MYVVLTSANCISLLINCLEACVTRRVDPRPTRLISDMHASYLARYKEVLDRDNHVVEACESRAFPNSARVKVCTYYLVHTYY